MKKQLLTLASIVFLLPMFLFAQTELVVKDNVNKKAFSEIEFKTESPDKNSKWWYVVETAEDLIALSNNWNSGHYWYLWNLKVEIAEDIDLKGYDWTPMGTEERPFTGSVYGYDHSISGLKINSSSNDVVGFFGYFDGYVEKLNFVDVDITGRDYVGGLCGYSDDGIVFYVSVTGTITGRNTVGGLCGYIKPYIIASSYSNIDIDVSGDNGGGLVGELAYNVNTPYYELQSSYSFGEVNGTSNSRNIGGLVGISSGAWMHRVYSNANVSGKNRVGNVCGESTDYSVIKYGIGAGATVECVFNENRSRFGKIIGRVVDANQNSSEYFSDCYSRSDMQFLRNGVAQTAFPENINNYNGISQSPDDFDVSFYEGIGWNLRRAESVLGSELYSIFIYTPKDTKWDGEVNNAWSNGGNWTNGVPNINSNVVIPNLEKAEVEVEVIAHDGCKSLTIGESVSIVVKPGGSLNVTGTIANNSPQTSEFVLQSDATGTGSLIHKSGAITVRYEQYIPANGAMIGSPVDLPTNTHFSDIKTVSGQSNMGIDVMNDMFMSWDENEVINGYTGIWTDLLTPVNGVYPMNTQSFEQGKGLFISYRNRTETIVYEGVARAENENVSTTYTSSSSNPGANFISNPFVATVASNNQANNSHNFLKDNISHLQDDAAALYIWDPQTSTYSVVNNISGGEYLLNPGQSFLVMTKENADLSFKQNTRMVATSGKSKDLNESRISIAINNTLDNSDVTDIYFSENMTVGVDKGYDAEKMMNEHVNIFTNLPEANEERFAVLALPTSYNALTIPVQMDVVESGRHTLTFSIDNVNANSIYFKDNETGEMTNLNLVSEVKVDLEAGLTEGRFELFIKERVSIFSSSEQEGNNLKGTITNINQDVLISLDEIIDGDVVVYNLSGQTVYSEKINGEQNKTFNTNLSRGYYVVKVQNNQGKILTEKVFIKRILCCESSK